MVQEERAVRTLCAADFVEIAEKVEAGGFVDKLEHLVAELECRLLETLTPTQFAAVQDLVQAAQILTEARVTLRAPTAEQTARLNRSASRRRRRAHQGSSGHRRQAPTGVTEA